MRKVVTANPVGTTWMNNPEKKEKGQEGGREGGGRGDKKTFWNCMASKGYVIGEYLGKGRTSQVFLAWSRNKGDNVAVKVVDRLKVKDDYYKDNLPKELSVWRRMRHQNIAQLVDLTADVRWTYSIMEYVPGSSDLDQWLQSNDLVGAELTRSWLFQLALALGYIKSLGYAHGDVKPKNIVVWEGDRDKDRERDGERDGKRKKRGGLKLLDFDCMKPLDGEPSTRFCGSFGYVAPEVFRREPHDPEKADVWSYGVTAYKLATHGVVGQAWSNGWVHRLRRNWLDRLPSDSRSFFVSVFQRQPRKRINLDELVNHPWINEDSRRPEFQTSPAAEPQSDVQLTQPENYRTETGKGAGKNISGTKAGRRRSSVFWCRCGAVGRLNPTGSKVKSDGENADRERSPLTTEGGASRRPRKTRPGRRKK